ncbi:MAG: TerB family tellurite resistance protein [Candidatus Krumholzibacteriia bacterium]
MGLLGVLVGGSLGFLLGGPLGAVIGGALGSQVGEPALSGDRLLPRPRAQRLMGRCPVCRSVVWFSKGETLACPGCGARLNTGGPSSRGGGFGEAPGGNFDRATRGAGAGARSGRWSDGSGIWGARREDDPTQRARREAQAQSAFMVALISLAAKVAKADGRVSTAEVRSFDGFLKNDLRMGAEDRRIAARIFNEARDSEVPPREFALQIRSILGHQRDRMRDLVTLLLKIGHADGRINRQEDRLIRSIAADLGLGPRDLEECYALFQRGDLPAAYALLGVESRATDAQVRSAYRRLAKEYHPDVIASKGLSEEFQDFAREKMLAVNAAYDQIKEARGLR